MQNSQTYFLLGGDGNIMKMNLAKNNNKKKQIRVQISK